MPTTATTGPLPADKPRGSKYTAFVLELLLAIAVAFFFAWPQHSALQVDNAQYSTDQATLANLQAQDTAYKSSVQVLQASNTSTVAQALPPTDSRTDLYAYIETLVNASSLTMTSVQVTDNGASAPTLPTSSSSAAAGAAAPAPALPSGVGTVQIQLVVTGTMAQFSQLLLSFQSSLRLIDVESVDVSVGQGGIETFTVSALTYYQL